MFEEALRRQVSPISMMGWSFVGLTLFQAALLASASLCLPTMVAPFAKEDEEEDLLQNQEDVELNPEALCLRSGRLGV